MSRIIDIKQDVINKIPGIYHIRKDSIRALEYKLKELRTEDIFNKHNMSYSWREDDDCIVLILYKSLDEFIR